MDNFQKILSSALSKIDIHDFGKVDSLKIQSNINDSVRYKFINYRNEINMTQKELAELSNVSQANISKFENGTYHPSLMVLDRIAKAMGKSIIINLE